MRGVKVDENAWSGWVYKFLFEAAGCFRQVAAILDWAENRHDQPISESDIRQIAVQIASIESTEKQMRTIEKSSQSKVHESGDVPTDVDALAKTEGGKKSGKGKDARIVSGVVHSVIRRMTVERRRLGSREQPCRRQFQAGKAKMKAAKAEKELCPSTSGQIVMRKQSVPPSEPSADTKGSASEIGKPGKRSRNRRCVNGNTAGAEDLVPMPSTLKSVRESIWRLTLVLLLVHCQWVLHLPLGCKK